MKLSAFIRDNIEAILHEWEQFAKDEQPITGDLSVSALRDHAKLMLEEIFVAIDVPESKRQQKEKSQGRKPQLSTVSAAVDHGLERLSHGFHITVLMSEYRYLRSSILRLWYEQLPKEVLDVYELIRFNEAVDQLIQESVDSYSTEKEKQARQLLTILSSTPDFAYILDWHGKFATANKSMLETFNLSLEELRGKTLSELKLPPAAKIEAAVQTVLQTAESLIGEVSYPLPSGEERQYEYVLMPVFDSLKNVEAVAAMERDVTERNKITAALQKGQDELQASQIELEMQNAELLQANEERECMLDKYTDLYDFAPVAYFTLDDFGAILAANLTATHFLGIEHSRILGMHFGLLVVNEHRQLFSGFLAKVFASDGKESCEVMLIPEGESPHYVQIEAIVIGADLECRFAVIDIDERKQAEEALRESELKYTKLFHSKLSGMAYGEVMLDEQGRSVDYRFLEVNDAFEEMTGLQKEIVEGRTAREVMPGIEKSKFDFIAAHGNVALTGEETTFETHQDYLDRWFLVHVYSPKTGFFVSIFSDITDRKRAEEQTKKSLAENAVMLKEIHHRVKNNLQVISSLISLQSDHLSDDLIRDQLNEVRDRVRSMALIHEKLYQTSDLARLNFADYATSLLRSLWRSYGALAEKVRLNLALSPVELSIEAAVPCGLILNELAGNVLKHAYPNGSGGEVTVGLEHDPSTKTVCLRVHDNGIGLPTGMDWRQSRSLGLRLVKILAGQLQGTVEAGTGIGTEFRITFPLKEFQA